MLLLTVLLLWLSALSVLLLGYGLVVHLFETLSRSHFIVAVFCLVIFLASFGFLTLYANHLYKFWIGC